MPRTTGGFKCRLCDLRFEKLSEVKVHRHKDHNVPATTHRRKHGAVPPVTRTITLGKVHLTIVATVLP